MKKTIYLDLDGTLLNVFDRLYNLYTFLLTQENVNSYLSKERYISAKRSNKKEEEIIKMEISPQKIIPFLQKRNELIESPAFLQYDFLPIDTLKTLVLLQKRYDLILVTKRKSEKNAIEQLKRLKMNHFFKKILITSEKYPDKASIIRDKKFLPNSMIIGDTEEDIQTGKELNITTIAVASGMRNKEILKQYHPDFMLDSITFFSEIEQQISAMPILKQSTNSNSH